MSENCSVRGMGVAVKGQRVHVGLHLFQLVLDGHSEFLFLVNNEQAEVEELHVLAHNAVRADEDVHLAIGQAFQRIVLLLGGLETVDVIHLARKLFQPVAECAGVLQRQNGGRHKDGHLLAIGHGLERCADGDLGLAEAHITTHEAVHRVVALHVGLHGLGGFSWSGVSS
jgi:hypothetical protein